MRLLILPLIFLSGCVLSNSELEMNNVIMEKKCLENSMELVERGTEFRQTNFKYNFVCMSEAAKVKSFTLLMVIRQKHTAKSRGFDHE
jgi:hypothetical protein